MKFIWYFKTGVPTFTPYISSCSSGGSDSLKHLQSFNHKNRVLVFLCDFFSTVLKTAFTEVSQIWLRIWWDDKFGDICTDSLALQTLGDSNARLGFPTGSVTPDDNSKLFFVLICVNLCQLSHCTEGWGGELEYWRIIKVQMQTLISCPIELQQQQQKITFDGGKTQRWQTKTFEYFEIPTNVDLWERKRSGFDAESPLQQLGWPPT